MRVVQIPYRIAVNFLLPRHYSGRKPNIMYAFGWYHGDDLKAVCTFGKPASNPLCNGVCGKEFSANVIELNRLCRTDDFDKQLSEFVSACIRILPDKIIISYADIAMGHIGKIYQACNFIYTGATPRRTDKYVPDGKHSRHYDKSAKEVYRKVRSSKHRYIYFGKDIKKSALPCLKYTIEDYPKGDSKKYKLGEYIQDEIIKV